MKNALWIEVHSAEEAFALLQQGQDARKTAATDLNSESSRSHSIFTVRLVSAPLNQRGNDVDRGDPSGRHPPRPPHVAEVRQQQSAGGEPEAAVKWDRVAMGHGIAD